MLVQPDETYQSTTVRTFYSRRQSFWDSHLVIISQILRNVGEQSRMFLFCRTSHVGTTRAVVKTMGAKTSKAPDLNGGTRPKSDARWEGPSSGKTIIIHQIKCSSSRRSCFSFLSLSYRITWYDCCACLAQYSDLAIRYCSSPFLVLLRVVGKAHNFLPMLHIVVIHVGRIFAC